MVRLPRVRRDRVQSQGPGLPAGIRASPVVVLLQLRLYLPGPRDRAGREGEDGRAGDQGEGPGQAGPEGDVLPDRRGAARTPDARLLEARRAVERDLPAAERLGGAHGVQPVVRLDRGGVDL